MAVQRALLVIADIGGYTRFMKVHRVNLAHAQDIVGQLLEAVIDGAGSALKLSKLEGDAALLYMPLGDSGKHKVHEAVGAIRRAFLERQTQLSVDRMCNCDSCTQVGKLKLKFVVHVGEIAIQKVKSFRELAGMDVILVHRMLKNSVPVSEYMLMTDSVLSELPDTFRGRARSMQEDFEGVGVTDVHYVDLEEAATAAEITVKLKPSFFRSLFALILMNLRSIIYIIGFRKPCAVFRNMDLALGAEGESSPASLPASALVNASITPPPVQVDTVESVDR